jgi:hypothetical protein
MGGYSKIDKNKIQPSPALAFLNGLAGGINAKKKELQDREDAQNKQAVDMFKYMQEQSIKERETVVKERGADVDEEKVQQAYLTIDDRVNQTTIQLKQLMLDMDKFAKDPQLQKDLETWKYNLDVMKEGILQANREKLQERGITLPVTPLIQTPKGLASAEQIKQDISNTGTTLIQYAEDARNEARIKSQQKIAGMEISSREGMNREDNEEAYRRAMIVKSEEGKQPEVKVFIDFSDGYLKEVANTRAQYTEKGKTTSNIPKDEMRRLDVLYDQTQVAYDALPPDVKGRLRMPERFTKTSEPTGSIFKKPATYDYVGGTPTQTTTQPLSSVNPIDYKNMMKQASGIKATYKTRQAAKDWLNNATTPLDDATMNAVLDAIYGKGK